MMKYIPIFILFFKGSQEFQPQISYLNDHKRLFLGRKEHSRNLLELKKWDFVIFRLKYNLAEISFSSSTLAFRKDNQFFQES